MTVEPHPLVVVEWPHITELPPYDFRIDGPDVHLGVYVRRVAGDGWHTLAGLVNHVVVAPQKRGKGRGTEALKDALAWMLLGEIPFAILHADADGVEFYGRLGFDPAPNFPAPAHRGERMSMVQEVGGRKWPFGPIKYVEPW